MITNNNINDGKTYFLFYSYLVLVQKKRKPTTVASIRPTIVPHFVDHCSYVSPKWSTPPNGQTLILVLLPLHSRSGWFV